MIIQLKAQQQKNWPSHQTINAIITSLSALFLFFYMQPRFNSKVNEPTTPAQFPGPPLTPVGGVSECDSEVRTEPSAINLELPPFTIATLVNCLTIEHSLAKDRTQPCKDRVQVWGKEEVRRLLELLKIYGSDFSIISKELGRTRVQVRRKFKAIEKRRPDLIAVIFEGTSLPAGGEIEFNEYLDG